MTIDHEPQRRHLVVGEPTKDVQIGSTIVGGDPLAIRFTVTGIDEETGVLTVQIEDLIGGDIKEAPMPVGTGVVIKE